MREGWCWWSGVRVGGCAELTMLGNVGSAVNQYAKRLEYIITVEDV